MEKATSHEPTIRLAHGQAQLDRATHCKYNLPRPPVDVFRHSNIDDSKSDDEGCDDYYCWKVTYYHCEAGQRMGRFWRRSKTPPSLNNWWEDDGEECPSHPVN
ncbi:MAG: hypothetical protein ACYTCN_00030 [Planctomycetota bacterium]